ncbi:hypothetical protein F4678DRAFT_457608 [Xylaria arbuscula]|nr:hypothetical protein F4678DRAFT_457608 [Xylaria arbuscula]
MEKLHPRPFAYMKSTDACPLLRPHAYKARELLNATVASFYKISDVNLTPRQERARTEFIKLFKSHARRLNTGFCDAEIRDILQRLMEYLDEFFFFGSVTALVKKIELIYFPPHEDLLGQCNIGKGTRASPQFEITLDRRAMNYERYYWKPATVSELVTTLAHEMIHVFLIAFVCDCPECMRNDFNAVGFKTTWHGPTFRGLDYAVMVSLASWSGDLDRIIRTWTNGTFIDGPSLSDEKTVIENMVRRGALNGLDGIRYLPYVEKPSRNLAILTGENRIIIDVEKLRALVRATAASFMDSVADGGPRGKPMESFPSAIAGNLVLWGNQCLLLLHEGPRTPSCAGI